MEHKGVEVSFIDSTRSPQVFKSANWWVVSMKSNWLSIIERTETTVVTKETVWRRMVETSTKEYETETIAMFPLSEIFCVKDVGGSS